MFCFASYTFCILSQYVVLLQDKLHSLVEPIAERMIWRWIRDIAMVHVVNVVIGSCRSTIVMYIHYHHDKYVR